MSLLSRFHLLPDEISFLDKVPSQVSSGMAFESRNYRDTPRASPAISTAGSHDLNIKESKG